MRGVTGTLPFGQSNLRRVPCPPAISRHPASPLAMRAFTILMFSALPIVLKSLKGSSLSAGSSCLESHCCCILKRGMLRCSIWEKMALFCSDERSSIESNRCVCPIERSFSRASILSTFLQNLHQLLHLFFAFDDLLLILPI